MPHTPVSGRSFKSEWLLWLLWRPSNVATRDIIPDMEVSQDPWPLPSWRVKSLDDRSGHDPVRPRSWQCWFICYGGIMTWSWWWSVMLVVFYINTCSLVLINRHSKKKEKKKLTYLKLEMCQSRVPCLNLLLLLLVPVPFQREVEFGHVVVMTWPCHWGGQSDSQN